MTLFIPIPLILVTIVTRISILTLYHIKPPALRIKAPALFWFNIIALITYISHPIIGIIIILLHIRGRLIILIWLLLSPQFKHQPELKYYYIFINIIVFLTAITISSLTSIIVLVLIITLIKLIKAFWYKYHLQTKINKILQKIPVRIKNALRFLKSKLNTPTTIFIIALIIWIVKIILDPSSIAHCTGLEDSPISNSNPQIPDRTEPAEKVTRENPVPSDKIILQKGEEFFFHRSLDDPSYTTPEDSQKQNLLNHTQEPATSQPEKTCYSKNQKYCSISRKELSLINKIEEVEPQPNLEKWSCCFLTKWCPLKRKPHKTTKKS